MIGAVSPPPYSKKEWFNARHLCLLKRLTSSAVHISHILATRIKFDLYQLTIEHIFIHVRCITSYDALSHAPVMHAMLGPRDLLPASLNILMRGPFRICFLPC